MISADFDIRELNVCRKSVSEADLKNALKKYNLKEALLLLGSYSKNIFSNPNYSMGTAAIIDKSTGVLITQDFLAYLSNILLISGANDFKNNYLSGKENNIAVLSNVYHNRLVAPYLEGAEGGKQFSPESLLTLMVHQQISHQKSVIKNIGRNYYIFNTLFKTLPMESGETPHDVFFREYGITVEHHFIICMVLWAVCDKNGALTSSQINQLADNDIPNLREILCKKNIECCLSALSANYKELREIDTEKNLRLQTVHTKGRFNPLKIYPIVKYETKGDAIYSIPNTTVFFESAFLGPYFMLLRYFENKNRRPDFTNYFGNVFNEYAGTILKRIYGQEKVNPEFYYNKGQNRFVDWWVEFPDKFYFFEVKSTVFDLQTTQTGDRSKLAEEIEKKVIGAILQIYKKEKDVHKYEELAKFRAKRIVPFVVFRDLPLISGSIYNALIDEALKSVQEKKGLSDLCSFNIHRINIEELEACGDSNSDIDLENIFEELKTNQHDGAINLIRRNLKKELKRSFPEEQYDLFMKQVKGA